jgi:hypothetical protein
MFYTTEEIRQTLLADPQSYFSVAVAFAKEELAKAGHPDHEPHVPLTECCYHYMTTNEQGNPMVMGIPCWLYAMRESEGEKMLATFAVWTDVADVSVVIPEIEVVGFYAENAVGERDHSRMLFCKQEEFAAIRQILQIVPVNKKTNHLSLVVDNVNTVEALAASLTTDETVNLSDTLTLDYAKLIEQLELHVSTNVMPSAKTTHYRHHGAIAVKAEDDGHFLRILRDRAKSGFYYRDALRRGETYAVIALREYVFIVGLRSHFAIWSPIAGDRFYDMHEQTFTVLREPFVKILQSL